MKPFILSLLKCPSCNAQRPYKLSPTSVAQIEKPGFIPDISSFRDEQDFLQDVIESVLSAEGDKPDISEADLYEFIDNTSNEGIVKLLFCTEVLEGSIFCKNCQDERKIRDGILIIN